MSGLYYIYNRGVIEGILNGRDRTKGVFNGQTNDYSNPCNNLGQSNLRCKLGKGKSVINVIEGTHIIEVNCPFLFEHTEWVVSVPIDQKTLTRSPS